MRSFGIRSSTTYSFYPLHNSAEFYLDPAIAFHQKQKCPQHIHHLTLGLNLTTIFSLRYKIHNCNNLLDRVGDGFCRRPLTPPDMRFRIRRFS